MERTIKRVAVYTYPPVEMTRLLEAVFRGEWNKYPECELISRHAGECPVWGAHITLLDAITIIEEDFPAFKETMREVIARHLAIAVGHPHLMKWGDNVFLRWKDEEGMSKLKDLRVELADAALPFAVTERVDWEKVNEVERLLDALGDERAPAEAFRDGLDKLKSDMMRKRWFKFIYALNVPLEWYLKARAKKPLADGKMPFSPSPHMSVATAVRADGETGKSAWEVGEYIKDRLPGRPEFQPLLGPDVTHVFASAHIVEPLPPDKAITVTVLDRITNAPRQERRQPWVTSEEIFRAERDTISDEVNGDQKTDVQQIVKQIYDIEDARNRNLDRLQPVQYGDGPGVTSCFIFSGRESDPPSRAFQDLKGLSDGLNARIKKEVGRLLPGWRYVPHLPHVTGAAVIDPLRQQRIPPDPAQPLLWDTLKSSFLTLAGLFQSFTLVFDRLHFGSNATVAVVGYPNTEAVGLWKQTVFHLFKSERWWQYQLSDEEQVLDHSVQAVIAHLEPTKSQTGKSAASYEFPVTKLQDTFRTISFTPQEIQVSEVWLIHYGNRLIYLSDLVRLEKLSLTK